MIPFRIEAGGHSSALAASPAVRGPNIRHDVARRQDSKLGLVQHGRVEYVQDLPRFGVVVGSDQHVVVKRLERHCAPVAHGQQPAARDLHSDAGAHRKPALPEHIIDRYRRAPRQA